MSSRDIGTFQIPDSRLASTPDKFRSHRPKRSVEILLYCDIPTDASEMALSEIPRVTLHNRFKHKTNNTSSQRFVHPIQGQYLVSSIKTLRIHRFSRHHGIYSIFYSLIASGHISAYFCENGLRHSHIRLHCSFSLSGGYGC